MPLRLSDVFRPLNLAAYLAWTAIGWELLGLRVEPTAWWSAPPPAALLAVLHAGFLGLFIWNTAGEPGPRLSRGLLLGQALLAFALLVCVRNGTLPILLVLCMVQLVHVAGARACLVAFVAVNAAMYFVYAQVWQVRAPGITMLMHASFQGFAALTAHYALAAERSRDDLALAHADLLATRSLLAESVRDSERLRLARELHDVAGHKLAALKLNLAALARDARFHEVDAVALCARLADELLADIRGVVQQMRLHDGVDLRNAVHALAAPFPTPRVHLALAEDARVGDVAQAEAVLRTVQEGLTNAVRHSGAGNVWITLRRDAGRIALDIRDDGRGPAGLRIGNGLAGMRERLEALGGSLDVGAGAEGGLRLSASLPVGVAA